MDFFNKISNMASDTYKKTSEKTSKLAKETKLKMKINENKSKIDDIYNDIGKIVYQKHIIKLKNKCLIFITVLLIVLFIKSI